MSSDDLRNCHQSVSGLIEPQQQPTLSQLRGICEFYGLNIAKNATCVGLVHVLEKNNVKMHFSTYNGSKVELRNAIVHWVESPQTSESDSDSLSSSDDCNRFECAISDYDSDERNEEPLDTNVDASLAIYEICSPSHLDVQFEEEVEMIETMDIVDKFK